MTCQDSLPVRTKGNWRLFWRPIPARWLLLTFTALTCASTALWANQVVFGPRGVEWRGQVLDDVVFYRIGGGPPASMRRTVGMTSLGVGVGWRSNLICGDMSLTQTLENQLSGVTDGFQRIMSNVIQNATQAVASLPALIIQRADPGLYNLLTNGILQARLDFDRSKMTCRAIGNRMADIAEGQLGWDQLAEGMALKNAIGSTDAVSAIAEAENSRGNGGVPWVGGDNAGGAGQEAIRIVGDITRAGYNLLNGRGVNEASPIDASVCSGGQVCETWPSPGAAVAWATRVLGEQEQRTCAECAKTQSTAGVGLAPLIQEEYEVKARALQQLLTGTQVPTVETLEAAGSSSIPITRGLVEALRDEPDQEVLARRLASEVALSSVAEKALLLQRILLAGQKEPNVSANRMATNAVAGEIGLLEQEINNLKTELELRRSLTSNSAMTIMQRQGGRSDASRGVFPGDARRNRLDDIQKPPNRRN